MEQVYPGVWKVTLGQPEALTPVGLRHHAPLGGGEAAACPLPAEAISGKATARGYVVTLPLAAEEQCYGLGLQLLSFNQRGLKKTLRVNSDPRADLGDSHAPVPFFASTHGYGVLIDTARYATFYFGQATPLAAAAKAKKGDLAQQITGSAETMYASHTVSAEGHVYVEVPTAAGVDVYIFAGPTMVDAVARYNRFSGGGCLPPRWGLGVWYRPRLDYDETQTTALADAFHADGIPCDVMGLEPGWQTHTYSCTYVWSDKFPDPRRLITAMQARGIHLNLWQHVFIHPDSPLYTPMLPYAGDFTVWGGIVPDLTIPAARHTFAAFQDQEHVALGVSGYKLDECDSSDYIKPQWSFPEIEQFPSGLDGEQYHSLLGLNYQETVNSIFRAHGKRTYNAVRSSHALAAPYPFVLYSDLYDHRDFLRGVVNMGFSGLLWCPEVRDAKSEEDLLRRIQAVVFSPQALINAWYIKNAPWKQWRTEDNNNDQFLADADALTATVRGLFELRMALVPYLYAAFARYAQSGTPPFRALVLDYPDDPETYAVDDAWLVGDRLLVAPVTAGQTTREVYLPHGTWQDFDTGAVYAGGQKHTLDVPVTKIPVFVKAGSILPLAHPTLHAADPAALNLTVRVYGDGSLPCTLFEDDPETYAFETGAYNTAEIRWDGEKALLTRTGTTACPGYTVARWEKK